jgi:hypothetical protein
MRLGGPQGQSGQHGEEKILDLIGTRALTPQLSNPQPVILTALGLEILFHDKTFETYTTFIHNFQIIQHSSLTPLKNGSTDHQWRLNCKLVNYPLNLLHLTDYHKNVNVTSTYLLICVSMPIGNLVRSQDSIVGIETGYGLDDSGVSIRVPKG